MLSKKWQDDRPLRTIFHEILFSSLPEHEKTVEHWTKESVAIITAAEETTAAVLQTAICHIFSTLLTHERLRNELKDAMPDACTLKEWRELQALLYLVSVSLSTFQCYDVCLRLFVLKRPVEQHRHSLLGCRSTCRHLLYIFILPSKTIWEFPRFTMFPLKPILGCLRGCCFTMQNRFPNLKCFDPSRWMTYKDISTSEAKRYGSVLKLAWQTDLKALEDSLKPFGGGPRKCIGMNLAYASLYHILAAVDSTAVPFGDNRYCPGTRCRHEPRSFRISDSEGK